MEFKARNKAISKRTIDTTELSIALFVLLSFTVQFFSHMLFSSTLLLAALLATGLTIIFLNAHRTKTYNLSTAMWVVAFLIIAVSILRPSYAMGFRVNKYVDLCVFFASIILLAFSGNKSESFYLSGKIIIIFSLYYAISVWIQILFPSLYNVFIRFMTETNQQQILERVSRERIYTGFTSNPGYTAGYIISGILLLFSKSRDIVPNKTKKLLLILFLVLSLLMTGRRAHTLFLLLALAAVYVFPYKRHQFFRRISVLLAIVTVLLLVVFMFRDSLMQIPFFDRILRTITNLSNDSDISSGTSRIALYSHAWKLFLANPWFGIGWGNYRYTTIGNVTRMTEMEAHNIYLQLLTETGITGFLLLILPMISIFIVTLVGIRRLKTEERDNWFPLLSYSLAYQVFFLLYGMTGNPFFDPSFLMMYFFSCAIPMAFIRFRQQGKLFEQKRNVSDRFFEKSKEQTMAF